MHPGGFAPVSMVFRGPFHMTTIAKSRKKDKQQGDTERTEDLEYLISDLSREFDVTLRALRFYEDRGLLSPRRIGTMRIYSAQDRARLSVILKGKQLGFTLADTGSGVGVSVLDVSSNGPAHAAGIRVGDVLLAINDCLLRSHQQAVELIDDPNTTRLKINKRF